MSKIIIGKITSQITWKIMFICVNINKRLILIYKEFLQIILMAATIEKYVNDMKIS